MNPAGPTADAPYPKAPAPPLDARAPRPHVARLRRGVVMLAALAAAGLLAGALAWAFVVQPELRAAARAQTQGAGAPEVGGTVRPTGLVADRPASYAQLDQLPEPRRLGRPEEAPDAAPQQSAAPPLPGGRDPAADAAAQARGSGLFFAGPSPAGGGAADGAASAPTSPPAADGRAYASVYNPHPLLDPLSPYELKAGAVIPAVMLTGVDTARPGPVVAVISENIFDTVSGRRLVIPQGARLIGRHEGDSRYGDRRAFLAWDRLILPNGKSLTLAGEPGVDAEGAVGVEGRAERRLIPLAAATLFAGAITTFGQIARDRDDRSGGWLGDAGDAASIQAAQIGGRLVERELQVRPSIRLRPGARVRVLITRDLVLEPYRP